MVKYKIFLLILLFAAFQSQAQQSTFSERVYRPGVEGRVFAGSAVTPQGNILFSAPIAKFTNWEQELFYLINPNLDTVWSRKGPKISFVEQDFARTSSGDYVLAGVVEQRVNNVNTFDILLHKIDANGQQLWSKTYNSFLGTGPNAVPSDDGANAILNLPDKGYVFGGFGGIPNKQSWYSVLRTDSIGNIKWRRRYDWASGEYLATMCFSKQGNILTAGVTKNSTQNYKIKLLLINSNGDSLKSNILNVTGLNRNEIVQSANHILLSLSDGGFLINATTDTTLNGTGGYLGMLVKVDSNLQLVWKHVYRPFFTPWRDFVKAEELADGSIVAVGFDRFSNIQPATNNIYLHHITAQGLPINIHTFTSAHPFIALYTMQAMQDSSFIVGGTCHTASNDRGFYAAKIKIPSLPKVISGLPTEQTGQKVELGQSYPNPATETAIIPYQLPVKQKQAQIVIRDITGRVVNDYSLKPGRSNLEVNLSNLSNGLYTYTLFVDDKPIATKKLAVLR